jgi:hypothetical protein
VSNFMGGMGLGALAGQLKDLKLGELLDTPPPGLDEAVSIAKVGPQAAQSCGCQLQHVAAAGQAAQVVVTGHDGATLSPPNKPLHTERQQCWAVMARGSPGMRCVWTS